MPLHQTSGNISARGYGFGTLTSTNDGTVGIFALGNIQTGPCCIFQSTTRNKYTYSNCSSTASGVASSSSFSFGGMAAGNSTRGIFALGRGCISKTTNKYTYANCTSTISTSLVCITCQGSATGNSTRGIFAMGKTAGNIQTTNRNKYTYSNCTTTATGVGAASTAQYGGSATGNSTKGIFQLGNNAVGGAGYCTRNKYTYACCTSTTSGVGTASAKNYFSSATGNGTRGIFALGYAYNGSTYLVSTTRNKHTYSCCTSTASGVGVASVASACGSAAGNSTRGIFALGGASSQYLNTRNKYTYSSCASTASGVGSASVCSAIGSAASWASCVNT
jgi:predicted RecA/RadA family phage recombinase